jgi:hypothetical protein
MRHPFILAVTAFAWLAVVPSTLQAQAPPNCPPGYTNNGATCGRGVNTISQPSEVANCPAGYTNNGATCGRSADSFSSGGSTVANCPNGYTNNGLTCGRGARSLSNGSILADCPAGFHNMGDSCYRVWPPKSLSNRSMSCPSGMSRTGGRCYNPCPAGYSNYSVTCYRGPSTLDEGSMSCGPNQFLTGGRCYNDCPAGYTNSGATCNRPPSTLGMDAMSCNPGYSRTSARCYKPCAIGYTTTGETCFRPASTLPRNGKINWITPPAIESQPFYNIAHMANNTAAAQWAVEQGANGLEMDLQFDGSGTPTVFQHGGSCDCSACSQPYTNVCSSVNCSTSTPAASHLNAVAGLGLALVYIDSKVSGSTPAVAGTNVINLLDQQLIGRGFEGIVIVSAPNTNSFPYIEAAAAAAAKSPNASSYYFGFDMERGPASDAIDKLKQLPGLPNLVYSTGITSCLSDTFYSEITGGVATQLTGVTSLTGIWTIDLQRSMLNYLQLGVRAIVTNRPDSLTEVIQQRLPALTLATPSYRPPSRRQ